MDSEKRKQLVVDFYERGMNVAEIRFALEQSGYKPFCESYIREIIKRHYYRRELDERLKNIR